MAPMPLAFMPLAGLNKVCKLKTAYRLSAISCLPRRPMNEVLELVGANAEMRTVGGLLDHVVQRSAGQRVERVAVLDIGEAHVEVAVQTDAMPAQVVILRRLRLDRCLVGQIGRHRVHRIDGRHRYRLRFESLLPLLEIGETLGHRLVLFAKLLGLSLDIRELIGVSRRCESQDGCC